jgi:hypothetical protein
MKWIYEHNADDSARFALGQIFDQNGKTLICFGINPSTASPENLDNTIRKIINITNYNGYDNWIMLNIYPQRATDPNHIHKEFNEDLMRENLVYIKRVVEEYPCCDILLAYGNLIKKRKYLKACLNEILSILTEKQKGIKVIKLTKAQNPVHPLYQPNASKLVNYTLSCSV